MLKNILFVILAFFPLFAHALPKPIQPNDRPFDMMKCTSIKNGTLWVSFGHMMRSGEDKITYFPTEIALFASSFTARKVYSIEEALKVNMQVELGRMRLGFTLPRGSEPARTEYITLLANDRNNPGSYMGNWAATEPGQESVMDLVSCSAR